MPPLTVMMKPASGLCNLRCAYCFYSDVTARRETASYGLMTEKTLDNLMRRAFAYADGPISLLFQGGEPTLAGKDFFRRALSLEEKYNGRGLPVHNAIQTNATLLDQEWAEIFKKGGFLVGVSLDGTRYAHDHCRADAEGRATYDRVLENVRLLRGNGVDYNVLCVVNRFVAEEPEAAFESLKAHRYLQFIPCLDSFDGAARPYSLEASAYGRFLVALYAHYEEGIYSGRPVSIRCFDNWLGILLGKPPESCAMAGRCGNYYLIEADGGVYPCDFYVLDRWRMGNVNEDSFFRMEKSPVASAFRRESEPLPDACGGCRWFFLCRGGCKRDREPLTAPNGPANRLCEGYRFFFERCGERMRKLSRYVGQHGFPPIA